MSIRPGTSAAFFDLDKTIIATSSTLAFSRPFYAGGLLNRRAMLRSAYAHFFYTASGADHEQIERMRIYLSKMVAGWEVRQVREIVAETLSDLITPQVYAEATALIAEHHEAGRDVVIVSASGTEVVQPIGDMLGADHVIATRMGVDAHGHYSGEIDFYAYAENKALAIRDLARQRGYDLDESFAYSDSFTDLPMLEAVGHPVAVNPDKALRRQAATRSWPVLDFHRPETLRGRFGAATARSVAAGALGAAGAATAGMGHRVATLTGEHIPHRPNRANRPPTQSVAVAIGAAGAATAATAAGIAWYAARRRERTCA